MQAHFIMWHSLEFLKLTTFFRAKIFVKMTPKFLKSLWAQMHLGESPLREAPHYFSKLANKINSMSNVGQDLSINEIFWEVRWLMLIQKQIQTKKWDKRRKQNHLIICTSIKLITCPKFLICVLALQALLICKSMYFQKCLSF